MAITPEVASGISAPVAKTAEAAGTVATPASKTAEAVGVVAVPIAKTAETAGTVAVPSSITSETAGAIAIPIAKTSETAGTIAIPIAKTAETAGTVAVPIAKTAEAVGVVAVPISKTAEAVGTVAIPASKTAETAGTVAIPIAKTAETAGAVAVPNTLTAVGAAAFPRTFTPTLNLDFKNGLYSQNGATKNQSDLITYSRNSNASYLDRFIDANGDWNYFLNTDHVGSVTNLLTYSEQFDNAAWTKGDSEIIANNTKNPFDQITAVKLIADSTASIQPRVTQTITSTATSNYTISIFVKRAEASIVQLTFNTGNVANDPRVNFDLSTGVIGSQDADIDSASITPVGNDWFRISATVVAAQATLIYRLFLIKEIDDGRTQTNDWIEGDGLFIWGPQINAGLKMLPYVKSIASVTAETQTESLRIEYDAATGESLGALIETASTNLCLRSEELEYSAWTKNSSSISTNSTLAPDNSTSADKVEAGSTATIAPNVLTTATSVATGSYTFSGYVKRSEASFIQIMFSTGQVANDPRVNFDLATGTIGSQDADIDSAIITPVGNDWFRISATVVAVGTNLYPVFHLIKTSTDTRLQTNAWTAGDGLYIWGAQIEAQAAPTSYIRTEASTVSRLADLVSAPVSGNAPSGDVTWFAEVNAKGNTSLTRYVFQVSATIKPEFYLDSLERLVINGRVLASSGGFNNAFKFAGSLNRSTNVMTGFLDGVQVFSADDGGPRIPTITGNISIGNNTALTTTQLNGHIKKLTIYDKALTAQEVALL